MADLDKLNHADWRTTGTGSAFHSFARTGVTTLAEIFERTCDRSPSALALECGAERYTYADLDVRANRLAHVLLDRGVTPGDRVGILAERSLQSYVAVLAVLKAGAAYVPLDPSFPPGRMSFIVEDAGLRDLVTTSALRDRLPPEGPVLEADTAAARVASAPGTRPGISPGPQAPSYVIYTSGTTGRPKGVVVPNAGIVNFLQVATPVYDVTAADRVYQGMSLSFDFHLEEMWPAWVAGATLVAGPGGTRRFGEELAAFLAEREITVLCSVPTMLTTLDSDLPTVRRLLVSGEPMPPDLVRRFSRPERRILNCYGPTETTVSASCAELRPGRPVTLGRPFPSYVFYVLDTGLRPVEPGTAGEICIGGPGVASGYLNRPDLTAERFLPNPVEADRAAVPRIYRTGDLGRLTADGEYEYLGRMDTQVKIRGFRVELGEIEQLLREDEAVETAVVVPAERNGVAQDLVGYVTLTAQADGTGLRERLHAALRRRLPAYMIPSHVEILDELPLLAADKVDRAALPAPVSAPLASSSRPRTAPGTPLEAELAAQWARALGVAEVSVEDDFFCDLGGHSLTAARLVSALRVREGTETLGIGDLYAHPTVRDLAAFLSTGPGRTAEEEPAHPAPILHSSSRVWACGLAQAVLLYTWFLILGAPGLALLYAVLLRLGAGTRATGPVSTYLRTAPVAPLAALWAAWLLTTLFVFPAVGGRLVLRGIRPGRYPLWGLTYLRFWFHGEIIGLAPLGLVTGTPLLPPYLRLLGARVGRGCHIAGAVELPAFVSIGDGASIGYRARVQPYVVGDGWITLAPIRVGTDAYIGVNATVLAGAGIGDGAAVGDQSLVHAGQRVPDGEYWAGSPAARAPMPAVLEAMAKDPGPARWPAATVAGYAGAMVLLSLLPVLAALPTAALLAYCGVTGGLTGGMGAAVAAGPLFVVSSCLVLIAATRLLQPAAAPGLHSGRGRYALRKWLAGNVVALTDVLTPTLYCTLYVLPYLRALGLRMGRRCEVARNGFVDLRMTVIGEECFLAGGVIMAPPVHHRGRLWIERTELGRRGFVGNDGLVPCGRRMGDNSLLGVLSVAPERPMEPETTWLGSPAFFLPRRQASESFPESLVYRPSRVQVAGRLAVELARLMVPEIILSAGAFAGVWASVRLVATLPPAAVLALLPAVGLALEVAAALVVAAVKWSLMGVYRPRTEPYWSMWVRRTELVTGLFETVVERGLGRRLTGTPWLAPLLRLFGAHVGRRTWLGSTGGTEFDLVHIGDDAVLGREASTQTHLFEDRVMKMSHVRVADRATVGASAVVLYDAEVGRGAWLDAMSLAMKGELLPAGSSWRGIPARPAT